MNLSCADAFFARGKRNISNKKQQKNRGKGLENAGMDKNIYLSLETGKLQPSLSIALNRLTQSFKSFEAELFSTFLMELSEMDDCNKFSRVFSHGFLWGQALRRTPIKISYGQSETVPCACMAHRNLHVRWPITNIGLLRYHF